MQVSVFNMRIFIKMIDTLGIEQRASALDAMHLIALLQQQFGQVCTVLTRNTRD